MLDFDPQIWAAFVALWDGDEEKARQWLEVNYSIGENRMSNKIRLVYRKPEPGEPVLTMVGRALTIVKNDKPLTFAELALRNVPAEWRQKPTPKQEKPAAGYAARAQKRVPKNLRY